MTKTLTERQVTCIWNEYALICLLLKISEIPSECPPKVEQL